MNRPASDWDALLTTLPLFRAAIGLAAGSATGWRLVPGTRVSQHFAITQHAARGRWTLTHLPSGHTVGGMTATDGERLLWLALELERHNAIWGRRKPWTAKGFCEATAAARRIADEWGTDLDAVTGLEAERLPMPAARF